MRYALSRTRRLAKWVMPSPRRHASVAQRSFSCRDQPVWRPPPGVQLHHVRTACDMREAVLHEYDKADVIIKAAAVSDYRPKQFIPYKVKKTAEVQTIELIRNPDILAELGQHKGKRVLVGFAAETEDLLANAQKKVQAKHLDLLVANDVSQAGSGFRSDENKVLILHDDGQIEDLPLMSKQQLAHEILARVVERLRARAGMTDLYS